MSIWESVSQTAGHCLGSALWTGQFQRCRYIMHVMLVDPLRTGQVINEA